MAIYVSVVWALLAVVYAAHPFPPAVMRPLAAVAYLAVAVWHEVRAIRRYGATVGKSRLGLRVESATDAPMTAWRLALRFALGAKLLNPVIVGVFYLVFRRFLHDSVVESRVVRAEPSAAATVVRSPWRARIVSAVAAAIALIGILLVGPCYQLYRDLGFELEVPYLLLGFLSRVHKHVLGPWVWALSLGLGVLLVWLPRRTELDGVAARWACAGLVLLAVVELLGLGLIGANLASVIYQLSR